MRKEQLIALIAFVLLASQPAVPPLRAQAASQEAVLAVVRRLFDGMRKGDSAMVRSVFDSTARMGSASDSAGMPRFTVGNVDRFVSGVGRPHDQVYDERIWDTEVRVDGGLASVWTKYAFYRGDQFNHCGVDVFELARRPDGWKIVYLADTRRTDGCWTGPK
jgi:hypothetical protein